MFGKVTYTVVLKELQSCKLVNLSVMFFFFLSQSAKTRKLGNLHMHTSLSQILWESFLWIPLSLRATQLTKAIAFNLKPLSVVDNQGFWTYTEFKHKVHHFTTDMWKSQAGDGYFSLTAHYIDTDFNLKHHCLLCRLTPRSHNHTHLVQTKKTNFNL